MNAQTHLKNIINAIVLAVIAGLTFWAFAYATITDNATPDTQRERHIAETTAEGIS